MQRGWPHVALRVLLGAVWVWAGLLKITDPLGSVRAVRAYRILPEPLVVVVGYGLPALEIALGLLLLVGFATRLAAVLSALLLVVFITGISWAWARGLRIECGCFGGGGFTDDPTAGYVLDLVRDVALLAGSVLVALLPDSAWSLDHRLRGRHRGGLAPAVAVLLLVLVAGGTTTVHVQRLGSADPAADVPQGTVGRFGIPRGAPDALRRVTVFEDFQCPFCRQLEEVLGDTITGYVEDQSIRVVYRPVAFLDTASTTRYSSRATEAAACVQDLGGPAAYLAMHGLLFAHQPAEGGAGLSDEQLVRLAGRAGASESATRACLADDRYVDWVAAATDHASRQGVTAIPLMLVDGRPIDFTGDDDPVAVFERAVSAAP